MQPIIIGAGLTGLTLAWYLKQVGVRALVIEARERVGGRIYTVRQSGQTAGIEMGATWLGLKHTALTTLLQALDISIVEQFLGETAIYEPISTSPPQLVQLPHNSEPSYRIAGGTDTLIKALVEHLEPDQIVIGQPVRKIILKNDQIFVQTNENQYIGNKIVCTIPPNLWLRNIEFSPKLPLPLEEIAAQTHTWMGESIKVGLTYQQPFWKKPHAGATVFSNVGPISELYDHSDPQNQFFALKGFLNGAYQIATQQERKDIALQQLGKYYGKQVEMFDEYLDTVWATEPFTYAAYQQPVLPHQNNGNPIFRQPYWNGKLFFGGSETAAMFPGYMDGAVRSAKTLFDLIR